MNPAAREQPRFQRRSRYAVLVVLTLAGVLTLSVKAEAAPGAEVEPDFELPFPCGEQWHGTTRAGHSSYLAVDFNNYAGEEWEHGHPVLASAPGTVLSSGFETDYDGFGYSGFGNYVLIDHGGGWTTFYAHLDHISPAARPGAPIDTGTVLGGVGNTGSASRNHLHYEQALDGVVQRATIGGTTLPWGVDVVSENCGVPGVRCVLPTDSRGTAIGLGSFIGARLRFNGIGPWWKSPAVAHCAHPPAAQVTGLR